jgi:hypothetical protein
MYRPSGDDLQPGAPPIARHSMRFEWTDDESGETLWIVLSTTTAFAAELELAGYPLVPSFEPTGPVYIPEPPL